MKREFTREEAIELLNYDTIRENIADLFRAIGARYEPDDPKVVYALDEESDMSHKDYWEPMLDDTVKWVTNYRDLNHKDRIFVSDLVVNGLKKSKTYGVFQIINGQNGQTQVSRQSLKHIMDMITYLEDYYGARAWISSVGMHSDVYYYTISFVIWKDHLDESKNSKWANLRPLYHG